MHPSDSFSGLQTALWQHPCPRLSPVPLPSAHPVHAVSVHANTTTPWLSWLIGSLLSTYFTALMKRRAAPEGQLQSCYWHFRVVGFLICSYTALGCNQPGPYPGKRPCAAVPICYQLDSFQLSSWLQQASSRHEKQQQNCCSAKQRGVALYSSQTFVEGYWIKGRVEGTMGCFGGAVVAHGPPHRQPVF